MSARLLAAGWLIWFAILVLGLAGSVLGSACR